MKVYESESYEVVADIRPSGQVTFRVRKRPEEDQVNCFWGYLEPLKKTWYDEGQKSISEALHEAIAWVSDAEFRLREASARVEAARDAIRALADIERELQESLKAGS